MKRYFASFNHTDTKGNYGFGNTIIKQNPPFDVAGTEEFLKKEFNLEKCIILYFTKLEEDK